ncbi:TonB-dependent receptor [Acidobacterium sp. S8]|uniref:TonB-dependent receptor n=1 Tax=Acidobacterium sp. S8 TaxID=1641854 RepID=UPI00131AEEE9|nr:TonB-dependent receptor [Acidobacterium sp. S8]
MVKLLLSFTRNVVARDYRPILYLTLAASMGSLPIHSQSTFGSIVGTIRDSSNAVVSGASVNLTNTETAISRDTTTNQSGDYSFTNLNPGKYEVHIVASGFEKVEFFNLDLQSRETKRVDAALKIGKASDTITVQGASAGVITTEVSNLSETKTGRELTELPVAVYSRSTGSTSPITTLTTEPGVQIDDNSNIMVDGTTPALMSYTIDGISSVSVENSGPINELFPSFNSISEIRISGSNNSAEFSGVADVTTTSKSGTNEFHGGVFENFENTVLTAGDPFTHSTPKLIMNDFGGFLGGPVSIPKLYSGQNKFFFFMSYEGLRLPREVPLITSVPSEDMRNGNLVDYLSGTPIYYPDGSPIDPANVPISQVSANMMKYFIPHENIGDPSSYQKNYRVNYPAPISSDQADLRLDYVLTPKQSMFARGTYKTRYVVTPPDPNCTGFCVNAGSPITGAFAQPETDQGVTFSYNYAITSSLVNELRAGFNGTHFATVMQQGTSAGYLDQSGIEGIQQPDPVPQVPNAIITGFMWTGGGNPSVQHSNIVQLIDNVTWNKGGHTFKFGADIRRMTDHDDNVFGNLQSGWYVFDNSQTAFTDAGGNPVSIGDPFTGFLLGYPDYTVLAEQVNHPAMNGLGYGYGFFAQDDWKITPRLTLNIGLRYELHPPLKDTKYNTAAFLPDYNQDGVAGAVAVPNEQALGYTSSYFAESISPSPILTAKQAGIPETLRYTYKKDFGPRIGFAWRPHGDDKMVLRGGWGRFIEQPLGFSLVSGWAVHSSFVNYSYQSVDANGNPTISFPAPFSSTITSGGASFQYAFPVHYIDPSVQQWNLTLEQDLGAGIGMRLSYIGSHGGNLETFVDVNQVPANTIGWNSAFPQYAPFQSWGYIQSVVNGAESNYNSMSVAATKRFVNGLQFQASYVWTRDLSDAGGYAPSGVTTEGGSISSDRFHIGRDYGNASFDRRHRFLTTFLYELPFGKGKQFFYNSGLLNELAGGCQLGGVVVLQSGAFLTPYQTSTDPAGTNMLSNVGATRADVVPNTAAYVRHMSTGGGDPVYLNSDAFTDPPNNSGGFGNAGVGNFAGPGTEAVSLSLIKKTTIREGTALYFGAEASNLLNHRNYDIPDMNVDDGPGAFGVITALQSAEGAGPRNIELTARITF